MQFLFPAVGICAMQNELYKFENQYRGRELPGFVNYKTFESIIKQQIKTLEEPAVDMLHTVTGECSVLLSGVLLPGQRKGRPKALAWLQRPPPGGFPAPASQTVLGLSRQQPDIRSFNSTLTLPAPGWHNPTVCGLGPSHYRSGGVGCEPSASCPSDAVSEAGFPQLPPQGLQLPRTVHGTREHTPFTFSSPLCRTHLPFPVCCNGYCKGSK